MKQRVGILFTELFSHSFKKLVTNVNKTETTVLLCVCVCVCVCVCMMYNTPYTHNKNYQTGILNRVNNIMKYSTVTVSVLHSKYLLRIALDLPTLVVRELLQFLQNIVMEVL